MKITQQKKQKKVGSGREKVWSKIEISRMGKADNECGGTGETQRRGRENWRSRTGKLWSKVGITGCENTGNMGGRTGKNQRGGEETGGQGAEKCGAKRGKWAVKIVGTGRQDRGELAVKKRKGPRQS